MKESDCNGSITQDGIKAASKHLVASDADYLAKFAKCERVELKEFYYRDLRQPDPGIWRGLFLVCVLTETALYLLQDGVQTSLLFKNKILKSPVLKNIDMIPKFKGEVKSSKCSTQNWELV